MLRRVLLMTFLAVVLFFGAPRADLQAVPPPGGLDARTSTVPSEFVLQVSVTPVMAPAGPHFEVPPPSRKAPADELSRIADSESEANVGSSPVWCRRSQNPDRLRVALEPVWTRVLAPRGPPCLFV